MGRIGKKVMSFNAHDVKAYGGVAEKPHSFLISALDGSESSASRLGGFNLGEGPSVPI